MAEDSDRIRQKIEDIQDIPTLPTVVNQILLATQSPSTNASDVGNMISEDIALTGKVLKLVNSSFYGFPQQIKTITYAIVILGFNKVKNIVLSASVFDAIDRKTKDKRFDIVEFWKHALGTAIASRVAARNLTSMEIEEAFIAGLIHDIGKVILSNYLTEECVSVLDEIEKKDILFMEAEDEVIGFGHDRIGLWLMDKWKLPQPFQEAVLCHHTPLKARGNKEYTYVVHVGDIVARSLDIGNGGDQKIPAMEKKVWKELGFSLKIMDRVMEETMNELSRAKEFLDMIES